MDQRRPTSIEKRERIPISFQCSQVLSIQLALTSQLTDFRVLVDFWDSEADDLRKMNREVDGELRSVSETSWRTTRCRSYRDDND